MTKKFKILQYNEYALIHLGIFQNQFTENRINGFFRSPITYFIISVWIAFFITAISFVKQNIEQYTVALRMCLYICSTSQIVGMFISFGSNAVQAQTVYRKLQELVDNAIEGILFQKLIKY